MSDLIERKKLNLILNKLESLNKRAFISEEEKNEIKEKELEKSVIKEKDVNPILTSDEKFRFVSTGKSFVEGGLIPLKNFLDKIEKEKQLKGEKNKSIIKTIAEKRISPVNKPSTSYDFISKIVSAIMLVYAGVQLFGDDIKKLAKKISESDFGKDVKKFISNINLNSFITFVNDLKKYIMNFINNFPSNIRKILDGIVEFISQSCKHLFTISAKAIQDSFGLVAKKIGEFLDGFLISIARLAQGGSSYDTVDRSGQYIYINDYKTDLQIDTLLKEAEKNDKLEKKSKSKKDYRKSIAVKALGTAEYSGYKLSGDYGSSATSDKAKALALINLTKGLSLNREAKLIAQDASSYDWDEWR